MVITYFRNMSMSSRICDLKSIAVSTYEKQKTKSKPPVHRRPHQFFCIEIVSVFVEFQSIFFGNLVFLSLSVKKMMK